MTDKQILHLERVRTFSIFHSQSTHSNLADIVDFGLPFWQYVISRLIIFITNGEFPSLELFNERAVLRSLIMQRC